MMKNKFVWRMLLLALALGLFLATSGNAQQTKQAPKASKPAKQRARKPRPQSSWCSSRRQSIF